ncbi:MAG: putative cytokinetic ring protein SteA [Actinomycetota bacterium]|nr:putative cytokinetic ring protein SteA [Actinomycetota bacterium]
MAASPEPDGSDPRPRGRGLVRNRAPRLPISDPDGLPSTNGSRPVPDRTAERIEVEGTAKVDTRTKRLLSRLQPGEIAVIDHLDLDRLAAEGLIKAGAGAVVNASRSISGRYPNMGPLLLVAAGIPLIDDVGTEVTTAVTEGERLSVAGQDVLADGRLVARGTRHTLESLEEQIEQAKLTVGAELERFAENTLEYLRREHHLLTDSPSLPSLGVDLAGRHVLVVVRGLGWEEDLAALRAYIQEIKPVLIAVDGGADALVKAGYRPNVIIGDFDSVSDETLRTSKAQLVVHAYPGGDAPGAARLEALRLPYTVFEAIGTSEDIAMLLAYEKRAELIVAVGTHASMVEFLDKGRSGMASTFLVRLKVGPILVDAKGVSRLYQSRVRKGDLFFLVLAALVAMLVIAAVADSTHVFLRALWVWLSDTWRSVFGS